jgi:hypothetical protein
MGQSRGSTGKFLGWLWREERGVARALITGAGILLICAPAFAASEIAVLSTVHVASAQRPAVIRLGAGTYDIAQDIGDNDFPDDATAVSVTGPGGQVPARDIPQHLAPGDVAGVFLGAWDCYPVMSFSIPRAGSYQVSVKDRSGMSGAWISEPWASAAKRVVPWAFGVVAGLLTIAVCLMVCGPRWRRVRRMARDEGAGVPAGDPGGHGRHQDQQSPSPCGPAGLAGSPR